MYDVDVVKLASNAKLNASSNSQQKHLYKLPEMTDLLF